MLLVTLFAVTGVFTYTGAYTPWPAALFFCAILAYIIPIFHYITRRTEAAFVELAPFVSAERETIARWQSGISHKSGQWFFIYTLLGVGLWLLQSWMLTGGFSIMMESIVGDTISLVMAFAPLPVWLVMTWVTVALIDNARLFRKLAARISVDLLDASRVKPFGRMAVSSTLIVIGAQALFPIMWLGADTDPWTTIPGLAFTTLPLIYLFAAATWPVHRALHNAKLRELQLLQERISGLRREGSDVASDPALTSLLVYRREVAEAAEWPFDISIVARFGLYLVIVPLTWIGAALIENVVDLFIRA